MQHKQPDPETTADFLGPYCAWPRCQCPSLPRCQQDEAYEKYAADYRETFDREFGR